VIHKAVHQLQGKAYPVARVCRLLRISRSGYYEAVQRGLGKVVVDPSEIRLKALFYRHERCFGSRRLLKALQAEGIRMGLFKIRKLMTKQGLVTTWKRKFTHTTNSKHDLPIAPNLLIGSSIHRAATRPG
jgi:hypothetical protein